MTGGRFRTADQSAEVTVVIVTYNSVDCIERLISSLRSETEDQRLQVVVADNASSDGTIDVVSRHEDVIVVHTGGNLGYAAGINAAMKAVAGGLDLLILNPDLRLHPGCLTQLRHRMSQSGAGIVVPQIRTTDGTTYYSLRREPSLPRALGDAVFGSRFGQRHGALSERVADPAAYATPHRVEWATGAALLVAASAAGVVGSWDEQFFLYSEETDFFRRARRAGYEVWYEPNAIVMHEQGGSGSSDALSSLMTVNRIRYARKHHGRFWAGAFRGLVAMHELARSGQPAHRTAFRYVISKSSWSSLPQPQPTVTTPSLQNARGAIIIPAHNEEAVIARTITALGDLTLASELDVIVAANGCTDNTAALAQAMPGVSVIALEEPSKPAALNAAEGLTSNWPRIYLDADIEITPKTVRDTLDALEEPGTMAARPNYIWNVEGVSWAVRRYYCARARLPSVHSRLWGAGVYGLSAQGRARFEAFPPLTADDLYVDHQFSSNERRIVVTDPAIVRVPRTSRALLAVLRRQSRGTLEIGYNNSANTALELLRTIRGLRSLIDATVYAVLSGFARVGAFGATHWERDDSSRQHTSDTARDR